MTNSTIRKTIAAALLPTVFLAIICLAGCQGGEQASKQETFASAEGAVVAMVDALAAYDEDRLVAIFGPEAPAAMSSGDPVADQRGRDLFIAAYHEQCVLVDDEETMILHVGREDWPFPIPLVKDGAGWRFDTGAGIEELNYRRIGRNELSTISVCEAYVAAQEEYAQKGHDGKPAGIYAQKFGSDPGKQNGLYWRADPGEEESPFGELAAEASAEGYTRTSDKPMPFRGYYFNILTAHGPSTTAGAESYLVDGEMRNGFALLAFPAEYRKSGVMTFLVDQSGIVYEKDLGEETADLAAEMQAYNPDSAWAAANSPDQETHQE
jgi:hypothetical protein